MVHTINHDNSLSLARGRACDHSGQCFLAVITACWLLGLLLTSPGLFADGDPVQSRYLQAIGTSSATHGAG